MNFRYNPFTCELADVANDELLRLRDVSEGWYVEYKSEAVSVKAFGKSLSAFANQYGGWLILGVTADRETLRPSAFPGLPLDSVSSVLESLRNAARDTLNPEVFYETRVFSGPITNIELPADRAVIVVKAPPSVETPHVHIDGRIYRRVGDSSAPKPETDRSILDRLWRKSDRAQKRLRKFVTRQPLTSRGEENRSYLHLVIVSDLYEMKGHWYSQGFPEFVEQMREKPIPFDNFFTHTQGFVARQVADNKTNFRLLTWEFCRNCDSFVTMPLNAYDTPLQFTNYAIGRDFAEEVFSADLSGVRFLDLNIIYSAVSGIISRHRSLAEKAGVMGPFFVKAHLQNVWRTVPFVDIAPFLAHVRDHGIPVVQVEHELVPFGIDPVTFTVLDECTTRPIPPEVSVGDAVSVSIPIFQALGVPGELFIDSRSELMLIGERFREVQTLRQATD